MRRSDLPIDKELLQVALIMFSAVSLATLEFTRNVFPAVDVWRVSRTTVVYLIILVQVLPAIVLLAADRLIAARYGQGRRLRVFRSVIFAAALLLILRQLQLYWDPATEFADSLRSKSVALLVLADLASLAAVLGLTIWLYRGLLIFFYYMAPVAIAVTAIVPFQMPTTHEISVPETYDQEVVTAEPSASKPAVFVLIFDEMGYDVLLEGENLDEDRFPNLAALAEDGVWFSNATSNYFWSKDSIPTIFDPVRRLTADYNVSIYTGYLGLEVSYYPDCGKVITCRGVTYLAQHEPLRGAGNLAVRSLYQALPRAAEKVVSRPTGWFLDRMGWEYPSVSAAGGHTLAKRQFGLLLDDIESESVMGRIHAFHLSVPHRPFVFDRDGDALDEASPEWGQTAFDERYREQVMFVDKLLGDLINKLKDEGIYDRSVIIATADHGPRPFTPIPERLPHHDTPRVPLVIHAPGLDSYVTDVDYQHLDFGATLADILGLPLPSDSEGVSAFSDERPERDKVFHADQSRFVYMLAEDSWRYSPSDGTLLKGTDDLVYVMDGGLRRHIAGPQVAAMCGYGFANVSSIPDSSLASIPVGDELVAAPCP